MAQKSASSKLKSIFNTTFMLGFILLFIKLTLLVINHFFRLDLLAFTGIANVLSNIIPITLMVIGGIGWEMNTDNYERLKNYHD
ncbi:hypothetical protein [Companilactobacillus jidongensis]|uniref:hypothetical protein n=1 Tax=Companilactobacillus jidongensis TaxID=2486006 RepID=UPI000F776825|nr:hypothetical protein [Companilactobacillus jidongensis]